MGNLAEKAVANHKKGYNCAQAVACAFCDKLGRDEKEVFELMEAFGFGMGTMGTCGAVSAMALLTGLKTSDGNLQQPGTKKACYRTMKEMTQQFLDWNKSVMCAEIKGTTGGPVLRSCDGCIEDAARIIEKVLL